MSVFDLGPTTKTYENVHFMVHVEDDEDGTFGLLIEPKQGEVSAVRVSSLARSRGFLHQFNHEYRSKASACRAARNLLNGPLSRAG
ncbi:hypothetical protein [Azospirillum argentinense]|uniref:Uncharacterized protein n=1 Tax=Azospirillum brasilense TaxID=192 RepID=A0A4D8QDE8_AZOBR|nr:hypothetical protein [Azospirillum argentinense]QCO07301.1 hypothetical protein D3867_36075 [Azospirillum argentinense]